jgi:hypothetical protein
MAYSLNYPSANFLFEDAPEGHSGNVAYTCILSDLINVSHFIFNFLCMLQGEGTQPTSLLSPPGPGSGRLCNARQICPTPHPSPILLASCGIADIHPNLTFCPRVKCCKVLTEIANQPGTNFSHRGEKTTQVHSIHTLYKQLAGSF